MLNNTTTIQSIISQIDSLLAGDNHSGEDSFKSIIDQLKTVKLIELPDRDIDAFLRALVRLMSHNYQAYDPILKWLIVNDVTITSDTIRNDLIASLSSYDLHELAIKVAVANTDECAQIIAELQAENEFNSNTKYLVVIANNKPQDLAPTISLEEQFEIVLQAIEALPSYEYDAYINWIEHHAELAPKSLYDAITAHILLAGLDTEDIEPQVIRMLPSFWDKDLSTKSVKQIFSNTVLDLLSSNAVLNRTKLYLLYYYEELQEADGGLDSLLQQHEVLVLKILIDSSDSQHWFMRQFVADLISRYSNFVTADDDLFEPIVGTLKGLLNDSDSDVVNSALIALAKLYDDKDEFPPDLLVQLLPSILGGTASSETQHIYDLVEAAWDDKFDMMLNALLDLIEHNSWYVRQQALKWLDDHFERIEKADASTKNKVKNTIMSGMGDYDVDVRDSALKAIKNYYSTPAERLDFIMTESDKPNTDTSKLASSALLHMLIEDKQTILAGINHKDEKTKSVAIKLLEEGMSADNNNATLEAIFSVKDKLEVSAQEQLADAFKKEVIRTGADYYGGSDTQFLTKMLSPQDQVGWLVDIIEHGNETLSAVIILDVLEHNPNYLGILWKFQKDEFSQLVRAALRYSMQGSSFSYYYGEEVEKIAAWISANTRDLLENEAISNDLQEALLARWQFATVNELSDMSAVEQALRGLAQTNANFIEQLFRNTEYVPRDVIFNQPYLLKDALELEDVSIWNKTKMLLIDGLKDPSYRVQISLSLTDVIASMHEDRKKVIRSEIAQLLRNLIKEETKEKTELKGSKAQDTESKANSRDPIDRRRPRSQEKTQAQSDDKTAPEITQEDREIFKENLQNALFYSFDSDKEYVEWLLLTRTLPLTNFDRGKLLLEQLNRGDLLGDAWSINPRETLIKLSPAIESNNIDPILRLDALKWFERNKAIIGKDAANYEQTRRMFGLVKASLTEADRDKDPAYFELVNTVEDLIREYQEYARSIGVEDRRRTLLKEVRDPAINVTQKQVRIDELLRIRPVDRDRDEDVLYDEGRELTESARSLVDVWVRVIALYSEVELIDYLSQRLREQPQSVAPLAAHLEQALEPNIQLEIRSLIEDRCRKWLNENIVTTTPQATSVMREQTDVSSMIKNLGTAKATDTQQLLSQQDALGFTQSYSNDDKKQLFEHKQQLLKELNTQQMPESQNGTTSQSNDEQHIRNKINQIDHELQIAQKIEDWFSSREDEFRSTFIGPLASVETENWSNEKRVNYMVNMIIQARKNAVDSRIIKQFELMSEDLAELINYERDIIPLTIEDEERKNRIEKLKTMREQLRLHAVPILAKRLPKEDSLELRELIAIVLSHMGGADSKSREAVRALVDAVVGEERRRTRRQSLLDEYYLKPSKERSEEASRILAGAVEQAKITLRILRLLSTLSFLVGTAVLISSVAYLFYNPTGGGQIFGILGAGIGISGMFAHWINDPLNRIQNRMADLVQLETAFTSFIWELNLNSTYIQSRYVLQGYLTESEIRPTVDRIERSMNLAMELVQRYTEDYEDTRTYISHILPNSVIFTEGTDSGTSELIPCTVHGKNLLGDVRLGKNVFTTSGELLQATFTGTGNHRKGGISIDHQPLSDRSIQGYQQTGETWTDSQVTFYLNPNRDVTWDEGQTQKAVWLTLLVNGIETNAVPLLLTREEHFGQDTPRT